jgi:hypothetical protein
MDETADERLLETAFAHVRSVLFIRLQRRGNNLQVYSPSVLSTDLTHKHS